MAFNTSLEALNGIFILLTQIKDSTAGPGKKGATGTGKKDAAAGTIAGTGDIGSRTKFESVGTGLKNVAEAIKMLSGELVRFYMKPKFVKNSIKDFIAGILEATNVGGPRSKNFEFVTKGLLNIATAIQDISKPLLGLGILVKMGIVDLAIKGISSLVDAFIGFGRKKKSIENGTEIITKLSASFKEIGKGFMYLGAGVLLLAGTFLLTSRMLGSENVMGGMAILVGSILLIIGAMWLMGKMGEGVKKGVDTTKDIGMGLTFLALGVLAFSLTIFLIAKLLAGEKGEKAPGAGPIMGAFLMLIGVIAIIAGAMWLLGKMDKGIEKGAIAMLFMAGGLIVFSLGLLAVLKIGEKIQQAGGIKTLLIVGAVIVALGAIMWLLGQPYIAPFVILGALTMIAMVIPLLLFAFTVQKLINIANTVGDPKKLRENVAGLITGVIGGLVDGMTEVLTGGKSGWAGMAQAVKNTAVLMTSIGLLMGVSLALSMFAFSLMAFAKAGAIAPITGYDKNGKATFGPPVDIGMVSKNVVDSFITFLNALIGPEGITKTFERAEARELKKLARALTGDRGIMSAIVDFAKVLEIFGKFGSDGKMAVPEYGPDGTPLMVDGKPKMKGVPIIDITNTIANAFGTFVTSLITQFSILELGDARRLKLVGKALNKSVLESVKGFADMLEVFAKYGDKGLIPVLDAEGKPVGPGVPIDKVVTNMTANFVKFIDGVVKISTTINAPKRQSMIMATTNLNAFNKELTALIKQKDGIEKTTEALGKMGLKLSEFSNVLDKMDTEKLASLAKISEFEIQAELKEKEDKSFGGVIKNILGGKANKEEAATAETTAADKETAKTAQVEGKETAAKAVQVEAKEQEKWDNIAVIIGQQVGSAVAASLRNGQFKFEFASGTTGGIFSIEPK